jgi:hypothetical protein
MLNLYSTNVRTPKKSGGVDLISVTEDNGFSVNPYSSFLGCVHMVHRYTRTSLYSTNVRTPKKSGGVDLISVQAKENRNKTS